MITSEKEINDAASALQQWFISQSLEPADAGLIMIRLMAAQFVAKTKNIHNLQTAVTMTTTMLALDIADCLRR